MIFTSIIFLGIGITMFFKPDLFWLITESWKSEGSYEPSYLYKLHLKFGGVIITMVGLFGLIVTIFFN